MNHVSNRHHDELPIHALIVSAGQGSRFGTHLPKQYVQVAGKTVLEHSAACLNMPKITDLTIVIAKDDKIAPSLPFDFDGPIHFTHGGAERFLSVKAGVDSIRQRVSSNAWVLIHDGARPCLPTADVHRLIGVVRELDKESMTHDASSRIVGAALATPVVDTLKLAQNHKASSDEISPCDAMAGVIDRTVDRRGLWQAQTPQVFRLHALQKMLDDVIHHHLMITDEASGFEHFGGQVVLVQGSRFNLKLTHPDDLAMIDLMLRHTQTPSP